MRPIWTRSARQTSLSAEPGALVRQLAQADRERALRLLSTDPVENLFVAARIDAFALDPVRMGCTIWGYERGENLVSLCHVGSNVVPVGLDQTIAVAFAERIGRRRGAAAIMGNAGQVALLHGVLSERWGDSWGQARDVRPHQPLMVIERPASCDPDPRVRQMTMADFDAYYRAAVAMYTEEVGVTPLDASGSYARYVRSLIEQRRAFGIVDERGEVIFKSDVGSSLGSVCQVQGVWLKPGLRGKGLSIPAMAAVVEMCRLRWPTVSLYVNDYNTRARRLYERVGFRTVGELATVLY
ncbi:MAG TPA: GNAT family N-acetyltransferase [Propionibacteriaceae bacterium]|nr:GNAT family N-acetyltransferase [Propionibacteriaceae bacterium]